MIRLYDPITDTTVDMPNDLHWVDEFDWSPVVQSAEYTIGGSLILEESEMLKGRPITLGGAYDDMGWVPRSVILDLITMRDGATDPVTSMTLTLWHGEAHARAFTVRFRQGETPVEATPVMMWNQTSDEDWYTLVLKLVEV